MLVRDLYHHSDYCLAVWLPASKTVSQSHNTTEINGLSSATRRYQVLCCYRLSRPGLLNGRCLRELVRDKRETWGVYIKIISWIYFQSTSYIEKRIEIYIYPVLPQVPLRKTYLSNGHWKWHRSLNRETLYTCWSVEIFLLVNHERWVTAGKEQCHCVPLCLCCCFPYKHWNRNLINIQLPSLIKAEKNFADIELFSATAAQRTWAHVMATQMLCFCVVSSSHCFGRSATAVGILAVSGL